MKRRRSALRHRARPHAPRAAEADRRIETAQASYDGPKAEIEPRRELPLPGILPKGDATARRRLSSSRDRARSRPRRTSSCPEGSLRGGRRDGVDHPRAGRRDGAARAANPGDPVVPLTSYQAGTDLATIADMKDLDLQGHGRRDRRGQAEGRNARAHQDRRAARRDGRTGKLYRIAPQATEKDSAKLFDVEIELDPAKGVVLRAGYSANADIVIREKKDMLLIPERLVTFEDGGKKAFVEIPGAGPKRRAEEGRDQDRPLRRLERRGGSRARRRATSSSSGRPRRSIVTAWRLS